MLLRFNHWPPYEAGYIGLRHRDKVGSQHVGMEGKGRHINLITVDG